MSTFSTNQAKQFYVWNSNSSFVKTGEDLIFKTVENGVNKSSDKIALDKITSARLVAPTSEKLQAYGVTLRGNPVPGQTYIIKAIITEFEGMTPEDKGFIYADYVAGANDTLATIAAGLAASFNRNAKKASYGPNISAEATGAEIIFKAEPQPWALGKIAYHTLKFTVAVSPITIAGVETRGWATIEDATETNGTSVPNSKKIADLERFCAGERGDVYRGVGYPNNFEFVPQIDPTNANGYHILDIQYYYDGDAEDVQKSPKELIIASTSKITVPQGITVTEIGYESGDDNHS